MARFRRIVPDGKISMALDSVRVVFIMERCVMALSKASLQLCAASLYILGKACKDKVPGLACIAQMA